ncbi:LPXTG cell wall anchor domain-containing protein [Streptomyces nanhaiensis]|uniref:LPXTG cell wall anchor domain-containing protein n=1 Tax=Streptomyces nanhaiensis TaxID=679319 RepID=UPI00399C6378
MRILSPASVVTAAAAACLLLAPTSHAISPATKGDNGTVKIHDAVTDAEYDKRNNPKVCEFYLDAFQFDAVQEVSWKIYEHPHSPEEPSLEGDITLDGEGHGRTEDMTLPDGQYKLYWTFEGKKGAPKHKVFKVDCESGETSGGSTGETTEGTTGGSEETTGGSTEGTSEGTSGESTEGAAGGEETTGGTEGSTGEGSTGEGSTGEATEGVAGGEEPGASTGDGGNLAETGSEAPVAALAAAAAALLGAGSYLVMRRRKATQG